MRSWSEFRWQSLLKRGRSPICKNCCLALCVIGFKLFFSAVMLRVHSHRFIFNEGQCIKSRYPWMCMCFSSLLCGSETARKPTAWLHRSPTFMFPQFAPCASGTKLRMSFQQATWILGMVAAQIKKEKRETLRQPDFSAAGFEDLVYAAHRNHPHALRLFLYRLGRG